MPQMRVLVVCMGNICRSPMAEAVFDHLMRERGVRDRFVLDSAGTTGFHAGEPPDPRTLHELKRHGIHFSSIARVATRQDFVDFDVIIAMDRLNQAGMVRLAPPGDEGKVRLMLEPTSGADVADPYYGGPDGFGQNFAEIYDAAKLWLDQWGAVIPTQPSTNPSDAHG